MKRTISVVILLVWLLFIGGPVARFIQDSLEIRSFKLQNWNEVKEQELKRDMREHKRRDFLMPEAACSTAESDQDRAKCIKQAV